ncbi:hypothetical protein ACFL2V_19215 [Pseudomonadota bacterium]
MASSLSPKEAAEAAVEVYGLLESSDVKLEFVNTTIKNSFDFENSNGRFSGGSGIFGSKTGFGVAAVGTGHRSDEMLVATRGTAIAGDMYNNLMSTTTLSNTGQVVHSGFNKIFMSLKDELKPNGT